MSAAQNDSDGTAIARSVKLYERLLSLYPATHRRDYGPAMAQLFRDQCRDAWRAHRRWGLLRLWLRLLPDLIKTSLTEHLSALQERKPMLERLSTLFRPRFAPLLAFVLAFVPVFFLVVSATTVVTFLMPELYSSTARLKLEPPADTGSAATQSPGTLGQYDRDFLQPQFELIQSSRVLNQVIEQLDLNQTWGKKYAKGETLKTTQTLVLLRDRLHLRPVRNSGLVEIRVFSESPDEAAAIANAVAESYRAFHSEGHRPEMVDRAVPGLRPVQPNKPLNIALGILGGVVLGTLGGAGMAVFTFWLRRGARNGAPPPIAAPAAPPSAIS